MSAQRQSRGLSAAPRALFAVLLLVLCGGTVTAHGLLPTVLLLVEVAPERYLLSLRSPLNASDVEEDPADREQPLRVRFPDHCHSRPAELICRHDAAGASLGLRGHALTVEANPAVRRELAQRAELIVVIKWRDGSETSALLRAQPEQDRLQLPTKEDLTQPSRRSVFVRYLRLGVQHIVGVPQGADHVLFLLALMLLVSSLRSLLWSISAFTLGHSMTLAAAALDLLRIPTAPVEILIALSIVFVARERLQALAEPGPFQPMARSPSTRVSPAQATRSAAAMACAFGLLHGLGFASALAEAGLPSAQRGLSLVSFNLGVEAGQLAWVLLWLLPWMLYRHHAGVGRRGWLRAAPAYVIGCAAAALTLSRLWDVFFRHG